MKINPNNLPVMQPTDFRVTMIGAGNLATRLACALHEAGCSILQVFSRTMKSATLLAEKVGAEPVCETEKVDDRADILIFALADKALQEVIQKVARQNNRAVMVHTAGSMPMSLFQGHADRHGVFYPMQTFSKDRAVDFKTVPFFLEASDAETLDFQAALAALLTSHVYVINSEQRRRLHLAAVFACNFANHCYALSQQVLEQFDIPFEVMLPLIDETAAKVHDLPPVKAQTGPAVRFDENVIAAQEALLSGWPMSQKVYHLMSESIHSLAQGADGASEHVAAPTDSKVENASTFTSNNLDKTLENDKLRPEKN